MCPNVPKMCQNVTISVKISVKICQNVPWRLWPQYVICQFVWLSVHLWIFFLSQNLSKCCKNLSKYVHKNLSKYVHKNVSKCSLEVMASIHGMSVHLSILLSLEFSQNVPKCVKICQNISKYVNIVSKYVQNVSKCGKMSKCVKICQNVLTCSKII